MFLGGALELDFLNGFAPGAYQVLLAGGSLSGSFDTVDIRGAACPYCRVTFDREAHGMTVDVAAGTVNDISATRV